jgi:hypothetical protein
VSNFSRSRLFWGSALSIALATGIPRLQHSRPVIVLITSVIGGLLFGRFILWMTDRNMRHLTDQGIDPGDMQPTQSGSIEVEGDLASVYTACRRSLLRLRKLEVTNENPITGELSAKTGCTWRSFGEKISVSITGDGPNATVHIESKPRLSTTQADYGKGVENVALFTRYLLSDLGETTPNNRWSDREI